MDNRTDNTLQTDDNFITVDSRLNIPLGHSITHITNVIYM